MRIFRLKSLQIKLIMLIVPILIAIFIISTFLSARMLKRSTEEDMKKRSVSIAEDLASDLLELEAINEKNINAFLMESMKSHREVLQIDLFRMKNGRVSIIASTSAKKEAVHFDPRRIINSFSKGEIVTKLESKEERRLWTVYYPLKELSLCLRIRISLHEADVIIERQKKQAMIISSISILLIASVIILFVRNTINKPISKLINAMKLAEEGKLDTEVSVGSGDEIEILTRNFNNMMRKIKESRDENILLLEKINKFNLELQEKIKEATRELENRNLELQRVNEILFQTQIQLGHMEKLAAVGQLAAIIAHEIGTPLNSISGYIQLLLREDADKELIKRRLEIMDSQVNRVTEILKNLLIATRPPAPSIEKVNIKKVLDEILSFATLGLSAKGIVTEVDIEELPEIEADPNLLQQAFLNIIMNAIDAMPDGGKLSIKAAMDGNAISISFTDTGTGIPPEHLKKIFDPFFTTKEKGKGAGLGLTVCKEIVKKHNGEIRVDSKPGEGSRFTLYFPLKEESNNDEGKKDTDS